MKKQNDTILIEIHASKFIWSIIIKLSSCNFVCFVILKPQTFHMQNDFVHNHLFHFFFYHSLILYRSIISLWKTSPFGNNLVVLGMQRSAQAHGPLALNSVRGPPDIFWL